MKFFFIFFAILGLLVTELKGFQIHKDDYGVLLLDQRNYIPGKKILIFF